MKGSVFDGKSYLGDFDGISAVGLISDSLLNWACLTHQFARFAMECMNDVWMTSLEELLT